MPVPGETIYSEEWKERNGKNIPESYWDLCRAICRDHGLGNDHDMEMVYLTIKEHVEEMKDDRYQEGWSDASRHQYY